MTAPVMIGPYVLIKELGCGGMAQVYLARRIFPDGKRLAVVIKAPRKGAALDAALLWQFERESELSMQMQHDNIVHAFDCGNHDGLPYLVMEYIPGCNLLELILRAASVGQPWDVMTAVHIVREVGYGLVYAHSMTVDGQLQRVVHRDVASKNIMVNLSGGVLLTDFGVATSVSVRSTHETIKGTLAYMAPEHCLGYACPASDAFGLGAILWELLEGKRFRADIPEKDIRAAVVEGRIPPLTRAVPPIVRKVCLGLLDPDAEARMRLCDALVDFEDFPSRRTQLERMMTHLSGGGVQASGLSGMHGAPALELVQTLAAVKAAGISASELRHPPRHEASRLPSDSVRVAVPKTLDIEPPSIEAAVEDAMTDAPVADEERPPATTVMGQSPERSQEQRRVQTARFELLPRASTTVVTTERVPAPWLARTDVTPVEVAEASVAPHAPHAPTPRSWGRIGVVTGVVILAGLAMLDRWPLIDSSVAAGVDEPSILQPVASAPPPAEVLVATERIELAELPEPDAVEVPGVPDLPPMLVSESEEERLPAPEPVDPPESTPPEPEPVQAPPTHPETNPPQVPAGPEPAAREQPRPAKPKIPPPSVHVVIKRGFVDHAEIQIGRSKPRTVPDRGALELDVPAGRHEVRWRTEVGGQWHAMKYVFEPRTLHTCLLSSSGPRIAKEREEGGKG